MAYVLKRGRSKSLNISIDDPTKRNEAALKAIESVPKGNSAQDRMAQMKRVLENSKDPKAQYLAKKELKFIKQNKDKIDKNR